MLFRSPAPPPRLAVILIGTNDLAWARVAASQGEGDEEGQAIHSAVALVAKNLLFIIKRWHATAPTTRILLVGLLPRGSGQQGQSTFKQPSIYTESIEEVNQHMKEYASQDGRLGFVDCTAFFLRTDDPSHLDKEKIPDALHPSGPGAQALADCLKPSIEKLLHTSPS